MKVRQNSVVKRKQMHRKSGSKDRLQTTLEEVPLSELDEQIKLKSQKGPYSSHYYESLEKLTR